MPDIFLFKIGSLSGQQDRTLERQIPCIQVTQIWFNS